MGERGHREDLDLEAWAMNDEERISPRQGRRLRRLVDDRAPKRVDGVARDDEPERRAGDDARARDVFARVAELRAIERRERRGVEGLDERPVEARRVGEELAVGEPRVRRDEGGEGGAEIAERKRGRRVVGEVLADELFEGRSTEHRDENGEVFTEAGDVATEELRAVDLEVLARGEPRRRTDAARFALLGRGRAREGGEEPFLRFSERRRHGVALLRTARARATSATSTSSAGSSSSHSINVEHGPIRAHARS